MKFKKLITICLIVAFAAMMVLPALGLEIKFRTRTDAEDDYIYFEMGSSDPGNGGRFHDASGMIIYEFPCPEGSKFATLNWRIQAQYWVGVTNTDPDDDDAFEPIFVNEPTEKELADGKADWGYTVGVQEPTHDLSKWCENNKTGKIWVKMADADPSNGWGGYIFPDYDITYYVGSEEPAPPPPPPPTLRELQDATLKLLPAGMQGFVTWHPSEEPYIYDEIGNVGNSTGSRFMDATAQTIYEFKINAGDKYASLQWVLDNQYYIEINNTDPENESAWTLIAECEQTPEEIESGSPSWGGRRFVWTPDIEKGEEGYKESMWLHRHDLSKWCDGNTTGKIWVRMGDADISAGWGGYISKDYPVMFQSSANPIVWAPSGWPVWGTDFVEEIAATPDPGDIEVPAETPDAGNIGTDPGTENPVVTPPTTNPTTPPSTTTFDAISLVALAAITAFGAAFVSKKKR